MGAQWLWHKTGYSQSRFCGSGYVPALSELNFQLSAPISSSGSESRTLVVEKQKVPVDLCHLIDLENFWEKYISWNCLKREIYTQKKLGGFMLWNGSQGARAAEPEPKPKIRLHGSHSWVPMEPEIELQFSSQFSSQTSSGAESQMAQLCVKRPNNEEVL